MEITVTTLPEDSATGPQRTYPRRETPSVLNSYTSLRRGRQELKVRLLQYSKTGPVLDIREFITSDQYRGFSKKGITLDYEQVLELISILDQAKVHMEETP